MIHSSFGGGKCLTTGRKPNDLVYTPEKIAQHIISSYPLHGKVLDPCRGTGVFYNNFPESVEKDWCEISEGRDFFNYNAHVDWIVSNPPYSILDDFLAHSFEIADNVVYLTPLSKIVSSMGRIRKIRDFGGCVSIEIMSASSCGFPFGFPACHAWFKRNYTGDTKITVR